MMIGDDNDGQIIFWDLRGLKFPDICLTGEAKPRKNLTQETCPDRGSNPGPLRDRRACYRLAYSSGPHGMTSVSILEVNMLKNSSILAVSVPINLSIKFFFSVNEGSGSSSGKALEYGLDDPGLIPGVGGVENFLHSFVSRLVVGSTQPRVTTFPC